MQDEHKEPPFWFDLLVFSILFFLGVLIGAVATNIYWEHTFDQKVKSHQTTIAPIEFARDGRNSKVYYLIERLESETKVYQFKE